MDSMACHWKTKAANTVRVSTGNWERAQNFAQAAISLAEEAAGEARQSRSNDSPDTTTDS